MNEYEYLIQQLNLLVGFLDVSDEKVYDQIKGHDRFNLGLTIEQLYQKSHENYSSHISSSAFILGFTHFEDFLTKQIIKYLTIHPTKNGYKVSMSTIREKGEELTHHVATEQAKRFTFSEKIKVIEGIEGINPKLTDALRVANDIRNCVMHNNGIADERLKSLYTNGEKIILSSGEVNGLGLVTRQLAKELWDKVK